jgi:bifunctional UDP-N-acetylglucosamine pyrophosphorylase/glucosamine-1-phosphate N-acetyltransferase
MRSATPKLAHDLCGWPLVRWPIEAARAAGARRIVVVEGPERPLAALLDDDVEVAIQREPKGTADALAAACDQIPETGVVLVLGGDSPLVRPQTLAWLASEHERQGSAATILTALLDDPSGYGRVLRDSEGRVARIVETKAGGDADERDLAIREVNAGIYAFQAAVLPAALRRVGADNAQGERYLPDVLPALAQQGLTVTALTLEDPEEAVGVNDRVALAHARSLAQRRILESHMRAGVTVVDPSATVIDVQVRIGEDAVIEPFSCLHGQTSIAAGATIGPHSTLIDAHVEERARVVHSYVTQARIGAGASVGPFAHLRPGAVLAERAKAGTFVEIKNSLLGAGAKVPHLSYVGDAEIGEDANLGAATITANYDGQRKHRTRIGARVRTGVDTTLVAPVNVGEGSYTGAGSVITDDVPAGALGIARARQRNVEGYAQRRAQPEGALPDGGVDSASG